MLRIIDNGSTIRIMRGEVQIYIFFFAEAEEFRKVVMEYVREAGGKNDESCSSPKISGK